MSQPVSPNRFPATCAVCGTRVAARAGTVQSIGGSWLATYHLACASGSPQVYEVRTSGWTGTRNVRGRCEDAPCCGCCTF